MLVDSKRRHYLITLRPDGEFHSHKGVVRHDDLIGHPEGVTVVSTRHEPYTVLRPTLEDFVLSRRKEKRIAQEISEELVNTFITGLEREDIEALSTALYKIPKATEKFAEHFIIGWQHLREVDCTRQVGMLEQATDTVWAMVKQFAHEFDGSLYPGWRRVVIPAHLKVLNSGKQDQLLAERLIETLSAHTFQRRTRH